MTKVLTITRSVTVHLTLDELAQAFCNMNDDEQAQFFCKVAAIAATWENHAGRQWLAVGKHLARCKCSTDAGRAMVKEIAEWIEHYSKATP